VHLCPSSRAPRSTAYFVLLDRGYRHGDLSVVYPLARATGPVLTIAAAMLLLGERPGVLALAGAALVILGAYLLTSNPLRLFSRDRPKGAGFALLTGCTIALYTVVDKIAMSHYLIPPIVFDWACTARLPSLADRRVRAARSASRGASTGAGSCWSRSSRPSPISWC
jgi:drug/metabolite transporter (DMT)-like permease